MYHALGGMHLLFWKAIQTRGRRLLHAVKPVRHRQSGAATFGALGRDEIDITYWRFGAPHPSNSAFADARQRGPAGARPRARRLPRRRRPVLRHAG
jgi:hypothetical protein